MPPSYHVHFGAGKLGLGFVLPILDNMEVPIALFQRPGSAEWEKLASDQDVLFQVNSEDLLDCKYVSDNCTLETVQQYIADQHHLFVSTCRIDLLQAILYVTHSFSTAVAAGGLDEVFNGLALLPSYYSDIRVYTFENDFKAVEAFRKKVNDNLPGLTVISVMCDRICTTREIVPVNKVNTITEEYPGTAVIFSSNVSYCHPFTTPRSVRRKCTPSNVVLARTPGEETFYYNRKFSLLNGIHYTMAVFTYGILREQGVPPAEWLDKRLSIWKTKKNEAQLQMLIEARIALLLSKTDDDTLRSIYNTDDKKHIYGELKAFSDTVLNRINSAEDDTAGRILNLKNATSVKTKYDQHFLPLANFIRLSKEHFLEFTDLLPHTHNTYLDVITSWDSKIRNAASAHNIDLPKSTHSPEQVKEVDPKKKSDGRVKDEDVKKSLSFTIWQASS
jgi:hypothetical protein